MLRGGVADAVLCSSHHLADSGVVGCWQLRFRSLLLISYFNHFLYFSQSVSCGGAIGRTMA